jgi:hypothetical protein
MVTLDVPKLMPDRTVQWVRVTLRDGLVICDDDYIRSEVEKLKPIGGPSGSDPNPAWTLARECKLWMAARIVEQTSNGNGQPPPDGVVA